MAWKIFGGEAVPKIFQTFNSLLGGIVRKQNATIVGPSKQLVGEFPTVDFERLYQYYHHWDQIKTAVDVMHQKFRGSGIEVKSNNEYFNVFIEKWWDISNSEKKWGQFIYSLLITGSAIMELQYTPDGRIGNIEQIPMQTIYRLFRDQFANELKIVQIVDGVFKELDPQYFIHETVNNPDRQAFGKSMFNTLASPRPITGTIDPFTGEAINPARQALPLLDAQAELQNAEIDIKKKMAKPRLIVAAPGMQRDQMKEVQAEMADPNTDQYIWIFDKNVTSAELQVQAQGKFDDYGNNVDAHIDVGTIFASNVIKNPQGFSYSGSQTPFDVLDQRMSDLQGELAETIKDRLLKPLAESWGFNDFNAMEVMVTFTPTMKRLTMEDIRGLDPEAVSKQEIREMYKKLNIPLDDKLWESEKKELDQDKQDQKNIQMQDAMSPTVAGAGDEPTDGENPFKTPPKDGDDSAPKQTAGTTKTPEPIKPSEPKAGQKSPFEADRPKPTPVSTPQPEFKKPRGESVTAKIIKQIANESELTDNEKIQAIKAIERIPLPPKAGDNSNSSDDLYVSQGIDTYGTPEITDPKIREEFGLDKDESELPPSYPAKMARARDKPVLSPSDNTAGRFTNVDNQKIDQIPTVSEDEYNEHLAGDAHQGGTGDDRINDESTGLFKDPQDRNNDMERTPETGNTDNPNPHAGPWEEPKVNEEPLPDKVTGPDEMTMKVTGGSDALPDNTKKQILGGNDNDEQPIVPSEGFWQKDYDKEEIRKHINSQNLGDANYTKKVEEANYVGVNRDKHSPDEWFGKDQQPRRDLKKGEDPFTSGTGEDQTPELNQVTPPQAGLNDQPLDEEPSPESQGTIDPRKIDAQADANNTTEENSLDLRNDGADTTDNTLVPPFDKGSTKLGDSSQVRLKEEERTGELQDQPLENDSRSILDNTGLNVEPEEERPTEVSQDDYNKHLQRQTQTGENPLEPEGQLVEDGNLVKPEDVQQFDKLGGTPTTPEGTTALDQDPNTINDPTDSGIDEEEIDPNVLHQDPETGINYTDLTDEQGEEVPDLRWDQTQTSDEEQPEVELEYEIVSKDEYEQHLNGASMSQGQFNDELESPIQDPEAPQPFEEPENPLDPVEKDEMGEPKELEMVDELPSESPKEGSTTDSEQVAPKEETTPELEPLPSSTGKEPKKSKSKEPKEEKGEEPKKNGDKSKKKSSKKPEESEEPKEKEGKVDKEDKKDLQDEEPKEPESEPEESEEPVGVEEIIARQDELIEKGIPEDEINEILVDEFGKDKVQEE